jgi:hypothetical protein
MVPLPAVPGAQVDGEVKLTMPGAQLVEVATLGLREPATTPSGSESGSVRHSPWRVYRYASGPLGLLLRVRPGTSDPGNPALIDWAELTSAPGFDGRTAHRLRFRVWHWPRRVLPLLLPPGSRLEAAWVDGHRLAQFPPADPAEPESPEGELRLPASPAVHQYEVLYLEDRPRWTLATELTTPLPELPAQPLSFRRLWRLPQGVVPLFTGGWLEKEKGQGKKDEGIFSALFPFPFDLGSSTEPGAPDREQEKAQTPAFDLEADWVSWEPLAGTSASEPWWVVRRDRLATAGLALAGFLLVWFALLGRKKKDGASPRVLSLTSRRRLGFLLLWLGAAGLGVLWLPGPLRDFALAPLVTAAVLALVWYLRSALRREPSTQRLDASHPASGSALRGPARAGSGPARRAAAGPGAAVVALACLVGLTSRAAGPEPTPVFLVGSDPDKQTVFAPPDVLDQLRALANRRSGGTTPTGQREPVLLSALYAGTVIDNSTSTRFDAVFQVYSFSAEPATLALPLTGVRLEEVLCDGAVVHPTVLAPGAGETASPGYGIEVKGEGEHVLKVRFRVTVTANGDDREVQFAGPRLVQNKFSLTVPAGAGFVHCPIKQGGSTYDPMASRLDVDLGRFNSPIQVRWRQEPAQPIEPDVQVRELYLWDLGVSASTLTGVLQYTIGRGAVSVLEVGLPELLEVRGVEVAAIKESGSSVSPPLGATEPARIDLRGADRSALRLPRVRDWEVVGAGQQRRLRLAFLAPVSAGVQVRLDLVPREPFGTRDLALPLPAPLAARTIDGFLAYRGDGLQPTFNDASQGVAYRSAAEFVTQWKQIRGGDLPVMTEGLPTGGRLAVPSYACFFHRDTPPLVLVRLAPQQAAGEAQLDVSWRLRSQQADLTLKSTVTAVPNRPLGLSLVEWEVPESVTVSNVMGAEVRNWSRSGSRVQAWLQSSARTAELTLTGWWSGPVGNVRPLKGGGGRGCGPAAELDSGRGGGGLASPCWRLDADRRSDRLPWHLPVTTCHDR